MDSTTASDNLLAQILIIVQDVKVSIDNFESRLDEARDTIESLSKRIDSVIESGFPRGDLKGHKAWHERRDLPAWKRAILSLILK